MAIGLDLDQKLNATTHAEGDERRLRQAHVIRYDNERPAGRHALPTSDGQTGRELIESPGNGVPEPVECERKKVAYESKSSCHIVSTTSSTV